MKIQIEKCLCRQFLLYERPTQISQSPAITGSRRASTALRLVTGSSRHLCYTILRIGYILEVLGGERESLPVRHGRHLANPLQLSRNNPLLCGSSRLSLEGLVLIFISTSATHLLAVIWDGVFAVFTLMTPLAPNLADGYRHTYLSGAVDFGEWWQWRQC